MSVDASLRQHVAAASSWLGRVFAAVETIDELVGIVDTAQPCAVIIDHDDARCLAALLEVSLRMAASPAICIVVVRGDFDHVPRGADIVADVATITDVLRAVGRPPHEPTRSLDSLLGVTVLGGPLEPAWAQQAPRPRRRRCRAQDDRRGDPRTDPHRGSRWPLVGGDGRRDPARHITRGFAPGGGSHQGPDRDAARRGWPWHRWRGPDPIRTVRRPSQRGCGCAARSRDATREGHGARPERRSTASRMAAATRTS